MVIVMQRPEIPLYQDVCCLLLYFIIIMLFSLTGTYIFVVEDDPNAKKKKKSKKPKGYAGSKTSRYDYPSQTAGLYDVGASVSDHTLSDTLKPSINSNMNESRSYEPVSTTKYQPEHPKGENRKPKSRYKKYGGAKTSYGEIGGSSYQNPGVSGRNAESNRYKTSYDDSSKHDPYQSGKYGSSHQYNPNRYDNKYGSGGYSGDPGSSRYGGPGYNQSKYGNYSQARPEYGGRSNEGSSRNYSSRYNPPHKYDPTSGKYSSPGSYYQPVAAKYYDSPKRYDPQPQYADVKPTLVDTHPKQAQPPKQPQNPISTFESRATLQLQKEDSPEHSVSDAIEKKATRYGGKYETKDGKIYYGGKPSKYSNKRAKKYNQRRKTMHPDPEETGKSDRTSV